MWDTGSKYYGAKIICEFGSTVDLDLGARVEGVFEIAAGVRGGWGFATEGGTSWITRNVCVADHSDERPVLVFRVRSRQ